MGSEGSFDPENSWVDGTKYLSVQGLRWAFLGRGCPFWSSLLLLRAIHSLRCSIPVCFLNVCTLKGDGNPPSQDMARKGYTGSPLP